MAHTSQRKAAGIKPRCTEMQRDKIMIMTSNGIAKLLSVMLGARDVGGKASRLLAGYQQR